ncbi:MAG: hypothetical protein U9P80_07255, partial [Thermodesulfobacteriota bacterium]|nr:hypothetical protein [Thermodesulfobacteriota bacterium]
HPDVTHANDGNVADKDQNRFYAIKNRWNDSGYPLHEDTTGFDPGTSTQTEDSPDGLIDITDVGYSPTQEVIILGSTDGWFFRLEDIGEKVVSRPITIAGVVYFTTYTPVSTDVDDICDIVNSVGTGRLYAINYKTGQGVYDSFSADTDATYDDSTVKDKRSKKLTVTGIPPQPRVSVSKNSISVVVGTFRQQTTVPAGVIEYYWMQIKR